MNHEYRVSLSTKTNLKFSCLLPLAPFFSTRDTIGIKSILSFLSALRTASYNSDTPILSTFVVESLVFDRTAKLFKWPHCALCSCSSIDRICSFIALIPFVLFLSLRYESNWGETTLTPRGRIEHPVLSMTSDALNKPDSCHGWICKLPPRARRRSLLGIQSAYRFCPRWSCSSTSMISTLCSSLAFVSIIVRAILFIFIVQNRYW